jgi:predicted methyltransferase
MVIDRKYLPRPITIDEIVIGEISKFIQDLMEQLHAPPRHVRANDLFISNISRESNVEII